MKNSFKLGFLALAITMSVAACNSNKSATGADSTSVSTTDSTSTSMMDTTNSAMDTAGKGMATGMDTTSKM
ncbi:MAG: hypothetical protein EOP42_18300 [Sphingobacteriaceae bacterium]|nr:MAG: hypothetical protein EOP42_18300 [Sphingobacteriaceae bacterium]